MKKIEIVTHYAEDDEDCSCDYYSVDVKIGGKVVRHYSDHYHDKGAEKADSFVDGYLFANGQEIDIEKPNDLIKRTSKADDVT
jgi:hypothetical protein